ncbi:MAG: hypothetical protein DHS20C17_04410 [Cyclobacteriaceae bacterium]|nr:MAG: hypothetical protein DHS20C17_04410 [Cyclobacteriaceae bacterium]
MREEIIENFGGKLRVRICGILVNQQGVLMVRHQGLSSMGYFWAPPGGGMSFGMSASETLINEFQEETGLSIAVGELIFIHEFHQIPLHALELFFKVEQIGGELKTGIDPEMKPDQQIIDRVQYFNSDDIAKHKGPQLHPSFNKIKRPEQLLNLKGYFQNWK